MVLEAGRPVEKPVIQAPPKVVQKWEEGEGKCSQKADRGFPVLKIIHLARGSSAVLFPPTRGIRQSMTGQR